MLDNEMSELLLLVRQHQPASMALAEVKPKNFRYIITLASYDIDDYQILNQNIECQNVRGALIYTHKTFEVSEVSFNNNFKEQLWGEK